MEGHVDEVFPVLLEALSDESDEVVILALHVVAEICGDLTTESKRHLFESSIKHLLNLFRNNRKLLLYREKQTYRHVLELR